LIVKRPSIDSCTKIYKVWSDHTCEQIASRNGITLERILLLNPDIDCFYIGKYDNQTITSWMKKTLVRRVAKRAILRLKDYII
jgi:hypothetical protein